MKPEITAWIVVISVILLFGFVSYDEEKKLNEYMDNKLTEHMHKYNFFRSKVGTRVVLDNDTVTVVNFNLDKQIFILSNGVEVDRAFIKN